MKRFLFTCLIFLFAGDQFLSAQTIVVIGKVREKNTNAPIGNVNIQYKQTFFNTLANGSFLFKAPLSEDLQLKFTHVSHQTVIKTISKQELNSKDTLRLDIFMSISVFDLDPVNILAQHPDTVVGNNAFFIQDFEFAADKILLLTTDRFSDVWSVQLTNEDQKIFSKAEIPVKDVLKLYRDFLGYINVICKEEVYRVKIVGEKVSLQQLPKEDFEWMIIPCVDTINSGIYYSNYSETYPEFTYFIFNRTDSTKKYVHTVIDKDLALSYSFEYDFLKPRDKLIARKLAQQNGMDKHDVAAIMTDYAHQRWFTPLYAPMFIVHDTVLIFDHYSDKLYKYDAQNKLVDSSKIDYHHPAKWREWRRELIKDDMTNSIYGLFLKDGFTILKEIDRNTGAVSSISKLSFPYVEKVKVKDDYAYYIYRPFSSLQTKFLYRERLVPSH